jgi:hypothetical protein
MTPRGIRNNNPGNIRLSKVKWIGEADDQPDADFVTFSAPEYGIRAICKILLNYQTEHQCKTIRQLISRWAPPEENNTEAYISAVSRACGRSPDEFVSVRVPAVMAPMVETIIRQETGQQPYPPLLIRKALSLAGIGPLSSATSPNTSPDQSHPTAAQGQPQTV